MTPCQDPRNDPDDWFIGRDGKQYSDDVLVDEAELTSVDPRAHKDYVDGLTGLRVAANLRRRRHARDLCFTRCPVRHTCGMLAFDPDREVPIKIDAGTYGGYFEEQRRDMASRVIKRRLRRSA